MDKLQELIEEFTNDKDWNRLNKDGTHRFDKEIAWIETMIKEYAEKLNFTIDKTVEMMEAKRTYSWPNYYQEANFPKLDGKDIVGIFDTFEAYRNHAEKHYKGFKCSACGTIGSHPQLCIHRLNKDGKCDWTSYGLFSSGIYVVILESGIKPIPIFEPVPKEGDCQDGRKTN